MKNTKLEAATPIEIVHAAFIWLGLYTYEVVASYVLRHTSTSLDYFLAALALTVVLALMIPLLGSRAIVDDIQEICWYDVFLQLLGFLISINHKSNVVYMLLAQLIYIMKMTRVAWPLITLSSDLPKNWPPFGVIGYIKQHKNGNFTENAENSSARLYYYLPILIIAAIALYQAFVIAAIPVPAIITVICIFGGTRLVVSKLQAREQLHNRTQHELGVAEGEAAAHAKSVAELTAKNAEIERQAAELQIKHAQLAQQALELATKNRQLEALSAERAAMMQDLAERNMSLRDANHDYKVPLLELTSLVDRAQEQATNAVQSKLLNRLDLGLEELRYIMADIIEQAKVSTELTTSQMQRLDVLELAEFFQQRFDRIAEKRGVSFEIREMNEAFSVFTNEMLLRRIITNLANNAILYAKPGREVTLSFRRVTTRCYVSVYDTGPGIQGANGRDRPANFDALIERIKQQRQPISPYVEESQGHGLGLQIVQRLCRELGTHIELKSKPGLGTVFRFSLPLVDN